MKPTLEQTLEAFQRTRSAAIVALAVELGLAALDDFTAPKARKNLDFQKLWLDAVPDVRARSWCLKVLTTQLPKLEGEDFYGDQSDGLQQRLNAMLDLAADPRIARAVLELLELNPPVIGAGDVPLTLAKLLEVHGDDETAAALEAIDFDWGDWHDESPVPLKLPARVELSPDDRATFTRAKPAPNRNAAALWRAVYESPDDDAPREVLSDFLQERGDPRGEFIALQLREARGLASHDDTARAQALAKAHGKTWLGKLRPITYRAEMRRGFLHRLELQGSWASKAWATLANDESLATVEELGRGQAVTKLVIPFLRSQAMRNQRVVEVYSPDILEAVSQAKLPKLEALHGFLWLADSEYLAEKEVAAEHGFAAQVLAFAENQQGITALGCDSSLVAGFSARLRERLTRFQSHQSVAASLRVWHLLPKVTHFICEWPEEIHLRRDDLKNLVVKLSPSVGVTLKGLPKSFRNVEIIGNAALTKRLQKEWGTRFTITCRPAPSGLITNPKG